MTGFQSPSNLPTKDWTKEHNAIELAETIRQYWHKRGYSVTVGIKSATDLGEGRFTMNGIFCIRSNMSGGYPPQHPGAEINWIAVPPAVEGVYNKSKHAQVRQ